MSTHRLNVNRAGTGPNRDGTAEEHTAVGIAVARITGHHPRAPPDDIGTEPMTYVLTADRHGTVRNRTSAKSTSGAPDQSASSARWRGTLTTR